MNMQQIRAIAKPMDIRTSRLSKINLIREIQTVEGNNACFATKSAYDCDQHECIWRDDCIVAAKKVAAV
ncbi:MAG: SAP domain-containing protein [Gammaproteobacteria bacterium]|nr:SAP domain-containing protein [Gammaproteobacteria bacterium]